MSLRVAVAGLKHYHVRDVLAAASADPGIEIVGIAEGDAALRREHEQHLGVEVRYSDHTELLDAEQFEVLVACEEFGRRGQVAIDALKAGRHVFSDKPLCTREEDLREIASLSAESGLEVGVDLSLCAYWGSCSAPLREGAIGEIVSCRIAGPHALLYDSRPKWYYEPGRHGGVINDLLGHGVDYCRWVCGKEITHVLSAATACVGLPQRPAFETVGMVHYQMEGTTAICGYADYLVPAGHSTGWQCLFVGTEGDATIAERHGMRLRRSGEEERLVAEGEHGRHPFLDFACLVRDGTQPLRTTEDALRTSMATLVAQRAAETGATNVPVPVVWGKV
jgi:predicted dehydrogenase